MYICIIHTSFMLAHHCTTVFFILLHSFVYSVYLAQIYPIQKMAQLLILHVMHEKLRVNIQILTYIMFLLIIIEIDKFGLGMTVPWNSIL